MVNIISKYFWLIRIIIRNFRDGTESHYPTKCFIKQFNLSNKNIFMKILNWQTNNKFR